MDRKSWVAMLLVAWGAEASGQAVEQEILANPAGDYSRFAAAIAADEDVLVVGSVRDSTLLVQDGSAFVFRRDAATGEWRFEQQLLASDPETYSGFGWSVAVDGDLIAVGARFKDEVAGIDSGAVYMFRRDVASGAWLEEQKLTASTAARGDAFGAAVAVSGDLLVAGAPTSSPNGIQHAGSAYVFRYVNATVKWVEEQQLVDPDAVGGIFFGDSAGLAVAIDGGTVFVASPLSVETSSVGSVGVWVDTGTGWSQPQELVADNVSGILGASLAARGGELVAGAPENGGLGAAVVFEWDGAAWSFEDLLAPSVGFGPFGSAVAIRENTLVVADPSRNVAGQTSAGSSYLFRRRRHAASWQFDQELAASTPNSFDQLGSSVALTSDSIFAGAPDVSQGSISEVGAVYRYDAAEMTLSIEPPDPAPGATIDLDVHRGDPGDLFLVVVEDVNGTPLFLPVIADVFGTDHSQHYQVSAPNPAFGVHVGLRAWKVSNVGPVVVSDWTYVDV